MQEVQQRATPPVRSCGLASGVLALALLGLGSLLVSAGAATDTIKAQPVTVLGQVVSLPDTVAEVQSPATGRILPPRENPYTVGDVVKKGDPLAIIEHRYNLHDASHLSTVRWDLLSVMLEARVAAVSARVEREKAERLFRLGTVSGQEVAALRAGELMAKAEYEKRKTLLEQQDAQLQGSELVRRGLFSPIDGVVSFVSFTQGQIINEGVLLFRVVNRKEVGFLARFPETDFRRWEGKAAANIHFDSLPGKSFEGRPEVVSPAVDAQSRTRDVLFRVKNTGDYLRYGMIGRLETR